MKEQTIKKCVISAMAVAGVGIICFLVKIIESFTREAHDWAKTFLVLGFVFVGLALAMLVVIMVLSNLLEKKVQTVEKKSDEELLTKYKSKK